MNETEIQAQLDKIGQAMAAQEALRGVAPEEQIEATLSQLRQQKAELAAQLAQAQRAASQANVSGGGAIAQGPGAHAVGERSVSVGGSVGGSIITGDQGHVGGIRANRIEAENVVQGMQQLGGELAAPAGLLELAEALGRGSISADSIQARNVVAGFQYIADPAQATPEELRQEVARLRQQLATAVTAGEVEATADVADVEEALEKAETELARPEPQGSRVVRKLKEATDILTDSARTAEAAGKLGQSLLKLAPVAAALYQIATKVFGG